MPVFVWILGDHRAVPVNYRHVHINEALLDWIFPGSNYSRLVTAAADDAGGRAFVTDFAGSSEVMDQRLYPEGLYDIDRLRGIEEAPELLDALRSQRFPQDNQMQALLRRHLPMSKRVLEEGVLQVIFKGDRQAYDQAAEEGWLLSRAESWFYGNMRDFAEYMEGDEYDLKALLDELEAVVVEPLRAAQELFEEYPYLTRLYTTLSVEEMTLAPMFDFNPDLPGVLRERRATGSIDCYVEDGGNQREWTEWTLVLELSDGRVVRTQPWVDSPRSAPAAALIEQLDTSGPPEIIRRPTPRGGDRFLKRTAPFLPAGELPEPLQLQNGHTLHHLHPLWEAGGGDPAHLQCPRTTGAHGVEREGGRGARPGELGRSG